MNPPELKIIDDAINTNYKCLSSSDNSSILTSFCECHGEILDKTKVYFVDKNCHKYDNEGGLFQLILPPYNDIKYCYSFITVIENEYIKPLSYFLIDTVQSDEANVLFHTVSNRNGRLYVYMYISQIKSYEKNQILNLKYYINELPFDLRFSNNRIIYEKDLVNLTLEKLKSICRLRQIKNYSKKNKQDLINYILENQ